MRKLYMLWLTVLAGVQAVYGQVDVLVGTTNKLTFSWANNATLGMVTSSGPYEGADHLEFDYACVSWWAGGKYDVSPVLDFSGYTHLVIAHKASGDATSSSLKFNFTDGTNTGPDVTVALAASATYVADTIPLSKFFGSSGLSRTSINGLNWSVGGGSETSAGKFYIDNIRAIKMEVSGAPYDIYVGGTNKLTSNWSNNVTLGEVTTNSPYEGTNHMLFDYACVSWWSGGKFDVAPALDLSAYNYLVVASKASDDATNSTLKFKLTDGTNTGVSTVVASNVASYLVDTIPLSKFYGTTSVNRAAINGIEWEIGAGTATSAGKFYIDNVRAIKMIMTTTSIEDEIQLGKIVVSPNPSTGVFVIENAENMDAITLTDNLGSSLPIVNTGNIDLTSYAPGMYFLKITKGESVLVKKLIKQ